MWALWGFRPADGYRLALVVDPSLNFMTKPAGGPASYSDTIDVLGTMPINGATVLDAYGDVEGSLTVATVPIDGSAALVDRYGITEPALTVGTVPINGATISNGVWAVTEPALTAGAVPIVGLTVTDIYTPVGAVAYSDTIDVVATVPITGLTVTDLYTPAAVPDLPAVGHHGGRPADEAVQRERERREKRRRAIEEAVHPSPKPPPEPDEPLEATPAPETPRGPPEAPAIDPVVLMLESPEVVAAAREIERALAEHAQMEQDDEDAALILLLEVV